MRSRHSAWIIQMDDQKRATLQTSRKGLVRRSISCTDGTRAGNCYNQPFSSVSRATSMRLRTPSF